MLKTLVAVRFQALISAFFRGRKKNQTVGAGRKILLGLIGVYLIAVYAGLFGLMFYGLCGPFKMMNLSALYFALAAFMSLTLSFAGSVFATQSQLYDANDN